MFFGFLQETGQESSWVEQKVTGKGGRKQEENFQKKQREEAQAMSQLRVERDNSVEDQASPQGFVKLTLGKKKLE